MEGEAQGCSAEDADVGVGSFRGAEECGEEAVDEHGVGEVVDGELDFWRDALVMVSPTRDIVESGGR